MQSLTRALRWFGKKFATIGTKVKQSIGKITYEIGCDIGP
jgi:hypothetical protein